MPKKKNKKTVFVMLSGGVDSSVAAALLKEMGYNVVGVYFKKYKATEDRSWCKEDGMSAQRVAESLGIKFKVYDLEKEYKEKVFDYFIQSYKKGLTPNPDIVCNKEIKFGEFFKRAKKDGADFIASGHYAKLIYCLQIPILKCTFCIPAKIYLFLSNLFNLKAYPILSEAKDKNKDQSYFLSQINPAVLPYLIFPLENLYKYQVRKKAEKLNLHTAKRKESQGVCFVGRKLNVKKFLSMFIKEKRGKVYNLQGMHIGYHKGAYFYTVGERRGFSLLPKVQSDYTPAYYVIAKNVNKNALIVGNKEEFNKWNKSIKYLLLKNVVQFRELHNNKIYLARIRHRGKKYRARLRIDEKSKALKIEFIKEIAFAPAKGQFVALYDGDKLIASAEISDVVSDIDIDKIFEKI